MNNQISSNSRTFGEFVVLLAAMVSILALSIDIMLPALGAIGRDLGVTNGNDVQLVVTSIFLGLAIGQLVVGPLSDRYGRKPIIISGYLLFLSGCVLSLLAWTMEIMLLGRVLQGLGGAAPRVVTIAMVRDEYSGRLMARIMSIIMAVFICVPAIAPVIGLAVISFVHWRIIFAVLLLLAMATLCWFVSRQPETLRSDNRRSLALANIWNGIGHAVSSRPTVVYTLILGLIFGGFMGYLSSSQQIFQVTFEAGNWFAVYFGVAALAMGTASYLNSKLVLRMGMKIPLLFALIVMFLSSTALLAVIMTADYQPDVLMFMLWLSARMPV